MSTSLEKEYSGSQESGLRRPASWLSFSFLTILLWGVWGATIALPEKNGFSAELGFVMWALSMLVPSLFALKRVKWKLDTSAYAVIYGSVIGILGGAGQLILYSGAIANGPAYLIFPIISLSPVVTILLSLTFLNERVKGKGVMGIALALVAIPFLNYSEPGDVVQGSAWLFYAILVFLAWGVQGYFLKVANNRVSAESIFFYMAITSLLISPIAWIMADDPWNANWGIDGAVLAFGIGLMNAFGALFLVYAFKYGKAILVSPMVNCLPPILTSVLSLILLSIVPSPIVMFGMALAIFSAFFLAISEESK